MDGRSGPFDQVFRNYGPNQAAAYAAHRSSYSQALYGVLLRHFVANDGDFHALLDVGCGTGQATRELGKHFKHATGADHSQEMVLQAREIGGRTKSEDQIEYEVASAEMLEGLHSVQPASVDLLTVGMAVHWFQLDRFWRSAERMVKPGGMVALWTQSSLFCHPSTPNASAVQRALSHLEDDILGTYETPSNKLSRDMYDNLTMPWEVNPPVNAFSRQGFSRYEWNRDGALEDGEADFFAGGQEVTLDELRNKLGTASMVTRWREANPGIAGTERDCVEVTTKEIASMLGVSEVDVKEPRLKIGTSTTLLMLKRNVDES